MKIKFTKKSVLRDGQVFNSGDIVDLEPELGQRMIVKGRAVKLIASRISSKLLEKK